jgi:branched-chain amino acid transport system permease protein
MTRMWRSWLTASGSVAAALPQEARNTGQPPAGTAAAARTSGRLGLALVLFGAFALLPLLALAAGEPFLLVIATRIMIFAIAALSLDLILGYGGMVSFGHAAFIGLGAYATGIAAAHGVTDLLAQMALAIVACGAFALVTGAISLRTRGVYFIMITLAFGQMAFFFMVSLSAYGGDDGLTLSARSTLAGRAILGDNLAFYYLAFAILLGFFLLLRAMIGARFGRVLRGIRDNPERMRAIGFTPFFYQLAAYCISGAMAGIAGVLLANQAEFVSPAYMSWQRSGELIVMAVLGGIGTLTGPVMGAAALIMLEELFGRISEHWKFGLGLALILIVLFTRGGLAGAFGRLLGKARHG